MSKRLPCMGVKTGGEDRASGQQGRHESDILYTLVKKPERNSCVFNHKANRKGSAKNNGTAKDRSSWDRR